MESIKPDQKYQTIVKLILVALLLGVVFILYTSRVKQQHPVSSQILLVTPQEVQSVSKNPSYQSVTGMLNLHHWVLDNGARVYFVPTPHLPMLDIDITFDAGSARDPQGKGGLSHLTNHLLIEGSQGLSADEIAIKLDELGVEFHTESHRDMALAHMRTLTDDKVLPKAVELLSVIMQKPDFPTDALSREKNNTQVALKHEKQSPGKVASRAFFEKLYQGNPYGQWKLGSDNEVSALTQADLQQFYKQYYTAQNAVFTLVGAVDLEQANAIVHQLAANLPQGKRAEKIPMPQALTVPVSDQIAFPSEQTHIVIGSLGMTRNDKDYYPLYVGNHILGGGSLTSRIFDIVRNQHGLAYSVYSYFIPMRATGPFIMSCQTKTEQAEKAQNLLIQTLSEFIQKGPTEDELQLAKQNLIGGYALDFDSNYSISRQVASLGFYDLPLNTFNEFKDNIDKLSVKDIQQAFSDKLSTDKLVILKVGSTA